MNDNVPLILQAAGKAALPAKLSGAITDSVEVAKAAELPFTAEGRFLSGSLYVSDGILTLPRELKEVRPSAAGASPGKCSIFVYASSCCRPCMAVPFFQHQPV